MLSLSYRTCLTESATNSNDCLYTVTFHSSSWCKGSRKKIYIGNLKGKGPRSGEKIVVKVFREKENVEEKCCSEVERSRQAQRLAKKFNKLVPNKADTLLFNVPAQCRIDTVSIRNHFKRKVKRVCLGECVLVERNLGSEVEEYMKRDGSRSSGDPCILDAFLHYSFHVSGGKYVICGFQGVMEEDNGYALTSPVIHSVTRHFGDTDKGESWVRHVMESHRCNNVCYDMLSPGVLKEISSASEQSDDDDDEYIEDFEVMTGSRDFSTFQAACVSEDFTIEQQEEASS